MSHFAKTLYIILFSMVATSFAHAEIKILSSIRPIYFLVEGVNQGINPQELLVQGRVSPHDYQPKPSDVQKLKNADIIFRIDEDFQPRFNKIFAANAKQAKIISLSDIQNIELLANQAHLTQQHTGTTEHGHTHSHSNFDLHIWLSPDNAIIITNLIALELSKLDPKNREKYQYNANIQIEHLQKLDQALHQQLSAFKGQGFFSYHDAYGYFTDSFGLEHSIALTATNHQVSAKKMQDIIQIAQQNNVKCIMLEPQLNDKLAKVIVSTKPDIKTQTWDPLGFELELTANSYHILLKSMANSLTQCLSSKNR